eukprot:COSAG01_NODE_19950_length_980_cov_1.209989_1_plen_156_part_00
MGAPTSGSRIPRRRWRSSGPASRPVAGYGSGGSTAASRARTAAHDMVNKINPDDIDRIIHGSPELPELMDSRHSRPVCCVLWPPRPAAAAPLALGRTDCTHCTKSTVRTGTYTLTPAVGPRAALPRGNGLYAVPVRTVLFVQRVQSVRPRPSSWR